MIEIGHPAIENSYAGSSLAPQRVAIDGKYTSVVLVIARDEDDRAPKEVGNLPRVILSSAGAKLADSSNIPGQYGKIDASTIGLEVRPQVEWVDIHPTCSHAPLEELDMDIREINDAHRGSSLGIRLPVV
jgi:hypothetical protein